MLILAIDTSTPTVTAGLVSLRQPHELVPQEGRPGDPKLMDLLAEQTVTDPFAHAERLMPLVNGALADAGRRLAELDAIVVGLGPGPFTGLRIGIATAQALGDALDIPVYGVGSHDAVALAQPASGSTTSAGAFLVVTDARRREVYLSAYSAAGRRLFGPAPVAPGNASAALAEQGIAATRMIGAGISLLGDQLELPTDIGSPGDLSRGLVLAAARALLTGVVPGPLTPLYLRRPDAAAPRVPKSVLGR